VIGDRQLDQQAHNDLRRTLEEACAQRGQPGHDAGCRWCGLEYRARHRMLRYGFPERLLPFHPEEIEQRFALAGVEYVRWWLANLDRVSDQGLGLVICGDAGSGRTTLATMLAKAYTMHFVRDGSYRVGFYPRLTPMAMFFAATRTSYYNADRWDALCEEWEQAGLWVLDDLGAEEPQQRGEDWGRRVEALEHFLRFRLDRKLPVIATAAMRPDQMDRHYSPGVASLLSSSGTHFRVVQITSATWQSAPEVGWGL
jgi:DNA replication protein DnaC